MFLGYDAEYKTVSGYVKTLLKTTGSKGAPIITSHSKLMYARVTWVKWKSDNPSTRMRRKGDLETLKLSAKKKSFGCRVRRQAQARIRTTR